MVYQYEGDWDRALKEYEASLKIREKLGDQQGIAKSRHQIGNVYCLKGDWDRALKEYEASLKIREKLGDQQGIAQSRHQIGMVYQYEGDWDRALVEYEASLRIEEQLGNQQGIAQSHGQLGLQFLKKRNFPESFEHTLVALVLFAEIGDPTAKQAAAQLALVRVQWGTEEFDKAWKEKTGEEVPDWLKKG